MDEITYSQLRNLPTCHHFLVTMNTKIVQDSMEAQSQWGQGKIILIHKMGTINPFKLQAHYPRIFNKQIILQDSSDENGKFCLTNKIIDPSIQKGFLSGVNGTMEHFFTLISIIDHALKNDLPLTITFIN